MPLLLTQSQIPLLIALLVALVVVGLFIARQFSKTAADSPTTAPAPRLENTSVAGKPASSPAGAPANWGYQLQKLDIAQAAASPFDLLVIDTTRDGSDNTSLTPDDVARLKRKPDGHARAVLAYLSIGEAESYRSYWDPAWKRSKPDWLLGENPDWKENYAVCFWQPEWQRIMCGTPAARFDRTIAAGFDGIYLDKCDVFEDLKRRHKATASSRPDIAGDMVRFIGHLSAYAKSKKPGFLIVMQNAEDLLERADLRAHLDGIAKEELIYGADGPEKLNSADDLDHSSGMLNLMKREGKLVLVVEYLDAGAKIRHAVETTRTLGFTLHISPKNRKLDRLDYEVLVA